MAKLRSPRDLDAIDTRSEQKTCRRLVEALSDSVQVFPSVPYVTETPHGARDGEIDLVLVGPERGLLVLEVRGGKEIAFGRDRGWFSTSHDGSVRSIKDPFEQATRNLYAVRDQIRDEEIFPSGEPLPFAYGHGCVFPDAVVAGGSLPMHAPSELCIDARALQGPEKAVGRLFSYWQANQGSSGSPSGDWADPVVEYALAPTFEAEKSLRVQIQREQAQFIDLTEEQTNTYNQVLRANRQALVQGGAGTGKTVLAQRRATELAKAGEDTLYLCFNPLLADHLAEDLSEVSGLTVATFQELTDMLCQRTQKVALPENPDQEFWDHWGEVFLIEAIEATGTRYDALVVDEAHDFHETWWSSLRELIHPEGYFYAFYDREQNGRDTNLEPIEDLPTDVPLSTNCRTTSRIRKFADELVDLGGITDAAHLAEGEPVETFAFSDRDEQIGRLEEIVRHLKQDIGLSSSEIVLLSPLTRGESVLPERLAGYHVRPFSLDPPAEDTLYHSTILGYKGMDATAVVLFDVLEGHVASQDAHVYVGCSRAQNLLYLLHEDGWDSSS